MPQTHNITAEHAGERLDKFLVAQFPDLSRSQIQKMIKSGRVLLNDKSTAVHHFLKAGDTITIKNDSQAQVSQPALASKISQSSVKKLAPEIITDTPDYLVINKPAGLLVHEAPGSSESTLVDWLIDIYPALKKIGEDPSRPGIVHRLDKEVSGLMVIPKTQDMFDHLKSQFKTRKTKKEYLALVYGRPEKLEDEINFNIDRSIEGNKMVAIPISKEKVEQRGRKANTKFEVVESYLNYTLLKVIPETGRTHQIRVHLNAYGLPIVGDPLYRPKKLKKTLPIERIFLHATSLGFYDLKNDWHQFSAEMPIELQKLIKQLQKG